MAHIGLFAKLLFMFTILSFLGNLELQNFLSMFASFGQRKRLFTMCPNYLRSFSVRPFLYQFGLLGDNQCTAISTLRIIDIDHKICHLTGVKEALCHLNLHSCCLDFHSTYTLYKIFLDDEVRVDEIVP